jgi:hypothetical protein
MLSFRPQALEACAVKRRQFITLLCGGVGGWRAAAHAQQPTLPIIGVINTTSPGGRAHILAAFSRAFVKPALSRGGMWRSSIAGHKTNIIDCPTLQPI